MKIFYSKLKIPSALLILLFSFQMMQAQTNASRKANEYLTKKGEVTFSFQVSNVSELETITSNLSILNYNPNTRTVYAWANTEQFRIFENSNRTFQVNPADNEATGIVMSNELPMSQNRGAYPLTFPLTAYPTYADYAAQMREFAINHPDICELVDIGGTTEGAAGGNKRLLFLKLSDNIGTEEAEPKVMYTSSIHGDEITGYPLMLNLINYFITTYKNTSHPDHLRIKNLIDNSEVWINPMANPDGTYYNNASNTSVANARRANANGLDLNRNYPDNVNGPHSNGHTSYELETQHFMNLASNTHFVLSANFHGGVEVVNYPWDNTYNRHADDNWFIQVSREYADNAQANSPNGYMDYLNNGITHGADWYRVYGGRQDYMNFTHQCKEITMEVSDVKLIPSNQLVNHWNYNREALIEYLIQGTFGFQGKVKDAVSGNPLKAKITLIGHDNTGSHTVSSLPLGDFYRPVFAGTYNILIEADCYQSVTLSNQTIANYQTINLADVLLTPLTATAPASLSTSGTDASSTNATWIAATADKFDLKYRKVGTPTWTEILGITTNPYRITGLSPNTTYEFQVKSYCGSNSTAYSSSKQFTTTNINYCNAQGNEVSDEYIGNVSINGVANNSVSNTSSGYSNFTASAIFSNLDKQINATGNTISVTKHWPGNAYREAVSAWIDFNQNGTFEASEKILTSLSSNTAIVTGTFNLPNTAALGSTRMRVLMKYYNNAGQNANNPCETFSYGEVEDYSINITDNPVISDPPTAVCQNITVQLDNSGTATIVVADVDGGSTDDVAITNYSIDIDSFNCSNIGTPVDVTLTVTDADGQTDTCVVTVTVTRQDEPAAVNCWDTFAFNNTTCVWENTGTQPTEPTAALECWETRSFDEATCAWIVTGTQPIEPTIALECWETRSFDTDSCSWIVTGTQPTEPTVALECWETRSFDNTNCEWIVTGTQPTEPTTALECWETRTFDDATCAWIVTGTQPTEPTTALECWETRSFDDTTCAWIVTGTQPIEPTTALECWETRSFDNTNCEWIVTGTQPTEPTTSLECWETRSFDDATCAWIITGTQPTEPTTSLECWETRSFDNATCAWIVTGIQPTEPTTSLECWETRSFDNTNCAWIVTGTQPTEPTTSLECWETRSFDNTNCEWIVKGTQPTEPTVALECWETRSFDNTNCEWIVTGTQPTEPTVALECWETRSFDNTNCEWIVTGTQPTEPTATNCWDNYVFNLGTCTWENQGSQPTEPTTSLECWETRSFDNTNCEWIVTGTQPTEPTTALECWETRSFDDATCAWIVTGTQPTEPTSSLECWETRSFDNTNCEWIVTGSQPTEPTTALECWETRSFDNATCAWIVSGTQPTEPTATNCWDNYVFNSGNCIWENTGSQPTEPTATNCWDNYVFNIGTCSWENTGSQPAEPTATNCWDNYLFNTGNCTWENQGSQPTEPTATNCWDNYVFNTGTCAWGNTGSQPAEPTATDCWDNYVFNTGTCAWENQGAQPTEPTTECWETASFNIGTCSWVINNDGDTINPVCNVQNITVELDLFGNATITAEQINNGSTDNCGINSMSITPYSFDANDIGENNVVFTISDYSGNTAVCNATVTVIQNTLNTAVFNYENVTIQPNPFNSYLEISLPSTMSNEVFTIMLFDLNGRLILKQIASGKQRKITVQGIDKLEQGPYFIKLINKNNGQSIIKKLIKY